MTAVTKLSCWLSTDDLRLLLAYVSDSATCSLAKHVAAGPGFCPYRVCMSLVHTISNGLLRVLEEDDKIALGEVQHALRALALPGRPHTYALEAFTRTASVVAFALETHWVKAAMEGQP